MRILILDDDLIRHRHFKENYMHHVLTLVTTVQETIHNLMQHDYDAIFLDHDLGGQQMVASGGHEPTGYDVAVWLNANQDRCPPLVYIHSFNPEGALKMQKLLPHAILVPGLWMIKQ
jgi:CheY-like chemotaxis protein